MARSGTWSPLEGVPARRCLHAGHRHRQLHLNTSMRAFAILFTGMQISRPSGWRRSMRHLNINSSCLINYCTRECVRSGGFSKSYRTVRSSQPDITLPLCFRTDSLLVAYVMEQNVFSYRIGRGELLIRAGHTPLWEPFETNISYCGCLLRSPDIAPEKPPFLQSEPEKRTAATSVRLERIPTKISPLKRIRRCPFTC